MSHFCLLVTTPTKPTKAELTALLLPYHEHECTGLEDYCEWVDHTDELDAEWATKKEERVRTEDGRLVYCSSDEFYRDPTPIPICELYASKADYAKTYHGYEPIPDKPGRFGRFTNPRAKWDYWTVGGRYTGHFVPGYDPSKDQRNIKTCWLCQGTGKRPDMEVANGCNGCNGTGRMVEWPTKWVAIEGDQVQLKNLPVEALRTQAEQDAAKYFDEVHAIVNGRDWTTWKALGEVHKDDYPARREAYNAQPVIQDLNRQMRGLHEWDTFHVSRAEYLKSARDSALITFAVLHDGKWAERGEMGWWGIVHDEKETWDWEAEFAALLDQLDPETWLTVVDCHI